MRVWAGLIGWARTAWCASLRDDSSGGRIIERCAEAVRTFKDRNVTPFPSSLYCWKMYPIRDRHHKGGSVAGSHPMQAP